MCYYNERSKPRRRKTQNLRERIQQSRVQPQSQAESCRASPERDGSDGNRERRAAEKQLPENKQTTDVLRLCRKY